MRSAPPRIAQAANVGRIDLAMNKLTDTVNEHIAMDEGRLGKLFALLDRCSAAPTRPPTP